MSNISQAFDVPLRYIGDGLDLEIPRLDIDDHAAWCEEIHAIRKPIALKLIPGNATPVDRFRMQRDAEFNFPTLDTICDLIYTPKGAADLIRRCLAKAGKTPAEQISIVKQIKPYRIQRLAMDLSGLFELMPPKLPDQNERGVNPLSEPGSESPISTPATGDGPGSSSANTSANPSAS